MQVELHLDMLDMELQQKEMEELMLELRQVLDSIELILTVELGLTNLELAASQTEDSSEVPLALADEERILVEVSPVQELPVMLEFPVISVLTAAVSAAA